MKKLSLIILGLLLTTSCFASEQVFVMNKSASMVVTPVGAGSTLSASSPVVTTAGGALPFGTTTNISKVLISVPSGTAYIGDSSISMATGLAWAATQGVLTLDLTDLSQVYWTGPAGQKLNFIVLK